MEGIRPRGSAVAVTEERGYGCMMYVVKIERRSIFTVNNNEDLRTTPNDMEIHGSIQVQSTCRT